MWPIQDRLKWKRIAVDVFGALSSDANRYVSDGVPLAKLTALEVTACGSGGFPANIRHHTAVGTESITSATMTALEAR
jgi:hypothetical protein